MNVVSCTVYRCSRQPEMYLYLRAGLAPDDHQVVPAELLQRTGKLTEVMQLELHAQRPLARVSVDTVMQALEDQGWFLQMPPPEALKAAMHWGD
nr:YcgL domain-containing protein [Oceanococcus sp. HetDA_MAG_MS8]